MRDPFDEPRDEGLNPLTRKSADGTAILYRFRVDAVVYAPSLKEAQERVRQANIYLDAAKVTN